MYMYVWSGTTVVSHHMHSQEILTNAERSAPQILVLISHASVKQTRYGGYMSARALRAP